MRGGGSSAGLGWRGLWIVESGGVLGGFGHNISHELFMGGGCVKCEVGCGMCEVRSGMWDVRSRCEFSFFFSFFFFLLLCLYAVAVAGSQGGGVRMDEYCIDSILTLELYS